MSTSRCCYVSCENCFEKNAKLFLEISSCLCGFAVKLWRRPEFPGRNVVSNKNDCWKTKNSVVVSGALLTALLRSRPYWAMAKRAFFLLVLETKTFLSSFKSGLGELDMDVYWRGGHSDRILLQIWCPERPFSRGHGCACLVWSSLIFLAL